MSDSDDNRYSKQVGNYRDLLDLKGKRALVIGAGSGIDRATAQGLADFGAEVTCADMNLEAARSVEVLGPDLHFVSHDEHRSRTATPL